MRFGRVGLNTTLLLSPGRIWSVRLLNRNTACVIDLLNHSKLPKGCIMNLVGISFLISFGVGWGKIFWKPRMVKCWGAARSGTTCSSHFQAWLSPSHKQNQYPCSREEPKSTWTGGPSFWTGTCRELTPFPTWYCTFVFLEQAPPVAFSVFYFKCWSYNIQPSVLVLMLSPYLQNWWGTWKKKKNKKTRKEKKELF